MFKKSLTVTAALAALCIVAFGAEAAAQAPPPAGSQERVWSAAADRVGAFGPRAWVVRGTGVTIAVIDSGVRTDHIEFGGALVGGYDVFTGRTGLSVVGDTSGHGTHVASLAAGRSDGRGMVGVASLASILPVRVFQGSSTSDTIVANGIRYATSQRAFVMNLSLGGGQSTAIRNALAGAVSAGQLAVIAAGNEGAANPSWPARHASESWANGQIIAVGAVDFNNQIASFSNRAGDARNFYLVAPGVNLIGAYPSSPTTYAYMSGTSMAAPIVAGAAAVVKSAWPYLSARDVANVLFLTATDLGAPGIDPVYGRGLVNLTQAMLPVGPVTAVGATGSRPLALASTTSAVTIGAKSAARDSGAFEGAVFDAIGRDFAYDFGDAELAARADTLSILSDALDQRLEAVRAITPAGDAWLVAFAPNQNDERLDRASVAYFGADGSAWAMSRGTPSPVLDAPAAPRAGLAPAPADFASPRVLTDSTALSFAMRRAIAPSASVSVGFVRQDEARFAETEIAAARESVAATRFEVGAQRMLDRMAFDAGLGLLTESGARLGDPRSSAFAVAGDARTWTAQAGFAAALTDRVTLSGRATAARTDPQQGLAGGIVSHVGDTTSLAYSASLATADLLAPGDRLDLTIGQPLMSRSGAMNLLLATGADPQSGAPIFAAREVSLATQTPEWRVELGYARRVGPASLALAAMSRFDADGEAGREEHGALMRAAFQY